MLQVGVVRALELGDDPHGEGLAELEHQFRLADDLVRHKLLRLPDAEATRRGLLGEQAPAPAAG